MLSFLPRGVLDEILNLIESVSEGFPSYSCIWPGVMIFARQDLISLKFIWHKACNKTQVEIKKGGNMPIWTGIS